MPRKKPVAPERSEDGHDAIVRRLLASRPAPPPPADPSVPPPDALVAVTRRFDAEIVPVLAAFSGSALTWRVQETRPGGWSDLNAARLVSPLTRDGRLACCIGCDADFLPALMAALFGSVSQRERDPTASELSVFAQLVVRLRDAVAPSLDHAAPASPTEIMRLFSPSETTPLVVELMARARAREGRLQLVMTRAAAERFLPKPETAAPARRMTALPLDARVQVTGPTITLAAIARLKVGETLPVARAGTASLVVDDREVATGRIGTHGAARAIVINSNQEPAHG